MEETWKTSKFSMVISITFSFNALHPVEKQNLEVSMGLIMLQRQVGKPLLQSVILDIDYVQIQHLFQIHA